MFLQLQAFSPCSGLATQELRERLQQGEGKLQGIYKACWDWLKANSSADGLGDQKPSKLAPAISEECSNAERDSSSKSREGKRVLGR